MKNTIAKKVINEELNGVELYFSVFPVEATRETLKKNGFRWNHKKSCWYAKRSMMTEEIADICAETTTEEYKQYGEVKEIKAETKKTTKKDTKKTAKVNKFGVKVGDLKNGTSLSCQVGLGSHDVLIKCVEKDVHQNIMVTASHQSVEVVARAKMGLLAAVAKITNVIYK